jgi:glutamyl/glutaminyl-tRNA synthetase
MDRLILAHVPKVSTLAGFVPLLLPYVASEAVYDDLLLPRALAADSRLAKACEALLASPKPAESDVAPAATASATTTTFSGSDSVHRLLTEEAAALREVAATWDAMPDADFGARPDTADAVKTAAAVHGRPVRRLMMACRIALVAADVGPPLSDVLALLGRGRAVRRLRRYTS